MKKEQMIEIRQRIREAIDDAGYNSAANFAKDMNVSPAAVSRWLAGQRLPTIKNLIDLTTWTNFSIDYILTGYEQEATTAIDANPGTPQAPLSLRQQGNQEGKAMPNDHLHFKLRIPENLHLMLKIEAAKHRRSITQEITKRLEESFTNSGKLDEVDLLLSRLARLIKIEEGK